MVDETNNATLQLDEVSILGNILFDDSGETMLTTTQHLVPEDFSDYRNREIYRACMSVQQKGRS